MSHSGGWPHLGNSQTMQPEVTGWGDAPIDHANNNKMGTNGWGNAVSTNSGSGWGSPPGDAGWGVRTPSTVDNGTSVWGGQSSSRNQPVNNWGAPSSQPPTQQNTGSGWNTDTNTIQQSSTPTSTETKVSTTQSQPPTTETLPSNSSTNSTPNTWAQAAAAGIPASYSETAKQSETQSSNQTSVNGEQDSLPQSRPNDASANTLSEEAEEDPVQKYVNSHEGWGKRPIQQNKSWNVEPMQPQQPHVNTGTEAWGNAPNSQWEDALTDNQQPSWDKPQQNWSQNLPPNRTSWSGQQGQGWGDVQAPAQPSSNSQMQNMNPNNKWGANAGQNNSGWGNGSNSMPKQNWGVQDSWDPRNGGNNRNGNWGDGNPNNGPSNQWNQPAMPKMPHGRNVDDGTSHWGNPETYKSVNMWEKKEGDKGQGWGVSRPQGGSPTGWGDPPPNKPNMDKNNGTGVWGGQNNSSKQGWNNDGGGWESKPINSWGSRGDSNQTWNQNNQGWDQPNNDIGGKDFGGYDRKTSTGSDNVFEDHEQLHGMPMSGGRHGGMGFGGNWGGSQFPGDPGMKPGMGMPRPGMPQNQGMMGQPSMRQQAPPMIQPNQFHQMYNAVSKGIISPQMLSSPQLMTPQYFNLLQQLIEKKTHFQKLSAQMQMYHKQQNLPPNMRQQQEHLARLMQPLQQQIQTLQRAIQQIAMDPLQSNKGMGPGPAMGGRMDMNPLMMPGPSGMNSFNMNSLMQSLPNQRPMNPNSRESRLNSYKKPSSGMENMLGDPLMGMVGGPMGLGDLDQGSFMQNHGGDAPYNMDGNSGPSQPSGLADIGPPEFTPGVPWKGLRPIDPENDPNMTPGSVANAKAMSINTMKDIDQVSSSISQDTMAQSYGNGGNSSVHPSTSLSHELWRVPLSKTNHSPYSANIQPTKEENWSNGKGVWLVLNNIGAHANIPTLQALCAKQGTITSFRIHYPVTGMALVQYATPEEAATAHKALDMKTLGDSMICANVNTDAQIENIIGGSMQGKWNQPRPMMPENYLNQPSSNTTFSGGRDMQGLWGGNSMAPPTSWSNGNSLRGQVWANDVDDSNNRMLSSLLPDGLLGSETM